MQSSNKQDFTKDEIEFLKKVYEYLQRFIENNDERLKKLNYLPILGKYGPIGESYKN